ncbi:nucleotidyltransferase [Clostridia bacterium OttesenSCG-928-F22]|nr:nucleotidyltransferase [Clostridia bacterium OttesenSCG-928-F22]
MKVCGIICEYNPFHNGHIYQIQKAYSLGYSHIICIMSGNFTQRGAAACTNKWARAEWALKAGADIVLELPAAFALQSAEGFAMGALRILDALGIVDALCFGCETDDLALLSSIATMLLSPTFAYKQALKVALGQGLSYATARTLAIEASMTHKHLGTVMHSPNNILAIEYIKALKTLKSKIKPLPIKRRLAAYHSEKIEGPIASASAIRKSFHTMPQDLMQTVPSVVLEGLNEEFIESDGLFPYVLSHFRRLGPKGIEQLPDVSEGLHHRIHNAAMHATSLDDLVGTIKTARYPQTRIQRICLNALLGITKDDIATFAKKDYPLYARALGIRRSSGRLVLDIKEKTRIPFMQKSAEYKDCIKENALFEYDTIATDLYALLQADKSGGKDFTHPLVIV